MSCVLSCTDELQKRNEVIRVLTKRALVVETREKEVRKELSEAQQQISELQHKQQNISKKCQDFEVKSHYSVFIYFSKTTGMFVDGFHLM